MEAVNAGHEPGALSPFGPFVLDTRRAALTRGGVPVPLRPKTLALLSYFAAHPGRVIGKDELLAAVWPGVVVTDDSLSQCVRELRGALGDDGARLIKTVARRGYLFDAPVEPASAATAAPLYRYALWAAVGLVVGALALGLATLWPRLDAPAVASSAPEKRTAVGIDQMIKERRSIAVLPFTEPGHTGSAHFAEAVTDALIADIARLPDTLVIARASSAAAAAKHGDIRQICRLLGVRYALTGTLRRQGEGIQVSAQFVAADSGAVIWSHRFDASSVADAAWQRDITLRVARNLDVRLASAATPTPLAAGQRLDAIDATMRGHYLLRRPTGSDDVLRARAHFQEALSDEPRSASALAGLAISHVMELEGGWGVDRQAQAALVEQLVNRALEIDPAYAPAHDARGRLALQRRDAATALVAYKKLLELNPSDAWAHARLALTMLWLGRTEDVAGHVDVANRLDPLDGERMAFGHLIAGLAEFHLGREEKAYGRLREAAASDPRQWRIWLWMAAIDGLHGRQADAARHVSEVRRLRPDMTIEKWRMTTPLPHPRLEPGRERFVEGLRKAGMP